MWQTINNITKNVNDKTCLIDYIKVDNILYTEAKQISNKFGNYFASIGKKVATKGGNSQIKITDYISKIENQPKSIFLTPCDCSEIKSLINKLPNKSSSGHDKVSNTLLKELSNYIIAPLHHIFNLSISKGVFPSEMKIADISPLFKNGSRCLLTNYRPISLLPTISKLLEKLIYLRVYSFLDNNGSFFKSQYGFRKKTFM